ncbi:MAG: hypothetical protein ACYCUD_03415 [Candidatus Dormibacteria bacterium]
MSQHRPTRARRSLPSSASPGRSGAAPAVGGGWATELALATGSVAAVSGLANFVALLVVLATMAHAGPPQGPITYLPVLAGAMVGLVGDALLLRGALGVLRPGIRFGSGRGAVIGGLAMQLVAAVAVGTLEAYWLITVGYLVLVGALGLLWIRVAPAAAPRPLAQHPSGREPLGGPATSRSGRWTLQGAQQPMPWSGEVPLPPSAPTERPEVESAVPPGSQAPATWKRPEG